MSAAVEALVVPALFLTVALLGGLRIASDVRLVPPPLVALVLAMLLMAALTRARVLRPERLMHSSRTALENLSGLVVLLTLFAASAQVFHLVTPDSGLLHLVFTVFFFVQLLAMLAGGAGRIGLLRSLVVLLGSAFVLRWIALEALYAPDSGTLKRVLTTLAEGVTLGTLEYAPHTATTGYLAFLALALYMGTLVLLAPPESHAEVRHRTALTPPPARDLIGVLMLSLVVSGCAGETAESPATVSSAKASADAKGTESDRGRELDLRNQALRSARVWSPPPVPVGQVDFSANPPGGPRPGDDVSCRFVLEAVGGTTPKFNCQLPDGKIIKVKYGVSNAETHAEVAATRLVNALGFGADSMFVVRRVRCAGCPPFPYQALKCYAETNLRACLGGEPDYSKIVDFDTAVIEHRLEAKTIEAADAKGWAWYELAKIDPAHGGASRAEVDAFRLLAVLISHWDNKAENQRLVCLPGGERPDGSCAKPLAIMQDLGATFGPTKLDLRNWRETPIWADARTCAVSMKSLPFGGATFPDHRISEEGRKLLLGLLEQLSPVQLEQLFVSSRITAFDQVSAEARDPKAWIGVFRDKVRQIREAGPCGA